jgi:hypothetical protein
MIFLRVLVFNSFFEGLWRVSASAQAQRVLERKSRANVISSEEGPLRRVAFVLVPKFDEI